MNKLKAYLNLSNKEKAELETANVPLCSNAFAVCVCGEASSSIDSECGAIIEFSIPNIKEWMADFRHSEYWCKPAFGNLLCNVPDETQGFIYKTKDEKYGVILPLVSAEYKCVLCGYKNEKGNGILKAKLFSWFEGLKTCKAPAFVYANGDNPFELLRICAAEGSKLLGSHCPIRENRQYPDVFEYLGWCSWDAMEIRVNEEGILKKCDEFKEKDIPVRWIIADDMWAEVRDFYGKEYSSREEMIKMMHSSRLYSFEADRLRFPYGLKHCIDKVKSKGFLFGIWHPTTGYWSGIDKESPLFEKTKHLLIKTKDGKYIPSPEKEKADEFYSLFHSFLKSCGADFLKIDNQSMCRRYYKNIFPVGRAAREFHSSIEKTAKERFCGRMINCMGMANEDMWNRENSAISRCSDDFLPENKAWFTKHILQCSYNSLIQGQLYFCDFDMWWTDDTQAKKNSLLRAISGGPIYISDQIDRSRKEIISPLVFSDGRILRCERPAIPTKDCLTENPTVSGKVFKLQNICNKSGLLAVFNLDSGEKEVCGAISPLDIEGLSGEEFAVYEHFSKGFFIMNKEDRLNIKLKNADLFALYSFTPLNGGNGIIGRTDKFISPATYFYDENGKPHFYETGEYAAVENYKLVIKNQIP